MLEKKHYIILTSHFCCIIVLFAFIFNRCVLFDKVEDKPVVTDNTNETGTTELNNNTSEITDGNVNDDEIFVIDDTIEEQGDETQDYPIDDKNDPEDEENRLREILAQIDAMADRVLSNKEYFDSLDNFYYKDDTFAYKKAMKNGQETASHVPPGYYPNNHGKTRGTLEQAELYANMNLEDYSAFYCNFNVEDGDKVVYLTMDCGSDNEFGEQMLDTYKDKGVKICFFVTTSFVKNYPDTVRRMRAEGHLVGNHTSSHPDLRKKSTEDMVDELIRCEKMFFEVTGTKLDPFMRPPQGAYNQRTLKIAQEMGYSTIFWSTAYRDYDANTHLADGYVTNFFNLYHHNGMISLMHLDNGQNNAELGDVIDLLRENGYRFGSLYELK